MNTRADLADTVAELLAEISQPAPFAENHQRVLREAMFLMAERGYHAASLRELARRLEMRQPSLYHYFASKEELVEQIVRAYASRALAPGPDVPALPTLAEGLRYALTRMVANYRSEEHVMFMRFLFAIGPELGQVQSLARELLLERGLSVMTRFVDLYVDAGELQRADSAHLVEMTHNAVAMRMLSRHVLFGSGSQSSTPDNGADADDDKDDGAFVEFVVDCALRGSRARREALSHG